ncbi:MAG: ATP-dependent Clp protease ATP-binding subunit ClpX [Planctomycetota bacterium]
MTGKSKPPDDRGHRGNIDHCSFCGRSSRQVERLIAGPPGVFICNECVDVCSTLLTDQDDTPRRASPMVNLDRIYTPAEIKAHLDEDVIGQEHAKRTIAVAVYNHYKRLRHKQAGHDLQLEKSNILMLGPTGCGKTLIARSLAKLLNVPFAIGDATTITEAGYVGEDVENLLLRLIQSADFDVPRAEMGILYIDEVDKIAKTSGNVSITRDVSGEGVQQSLLKLIEGSVSNVPPGGGRKHPEQKYISINTEDILFICGGAFDGLSEIIGRRIGERVIGFRFDSESDEDARRRDVIESGDELALLEYVTPEDLVQYGMIPEFVGRVPVSTSLSALDEDALVRILIEPKHALVKQYQALFAMDDAELSFTDGALRAIARKALTRKTGARALRSILEDLMLDIMFELPDRAQDQSHYRITADVVEGRRSIFSGHERAERKERA